MIDHVLGRPSVKSRRLQVLGVLAFWVFYLFKGNKNGPPGIRRLSRALSRRLSVWQTVLMTMIYLYAARNFSTLVGLASPEPLANMYDATYFRATWVLTALDAGFWTAMKIRNRWLRDLSSVVFSLFYLVAAERADEKVRKVRGAITVDHMRVSWHKATTPYLGFLNRVVRPRLTRWPPRQLRIPRPANSDYTEPVIAWLYFDGPLTHLERHSRLVLDIPGGGFVAMDPRCNDDKLFAWATRTGLPILSLDYRKAPEYPYPYALNECFDVYATIINTRGRCVGMSGKEEPRVVITGDSAGGNLAVSATLMILETACGRVPNRPLLPPPEGLVCVYPALDMNIGNWMTDEQMSLIRDRRMRKTNRSIVRRQSMQYNDLVGTPHHSDDEQDDKDQHVDLKRRRGSRAKTTNHTGSCSNSQESQPEFSHSGPLALSDGRNKKMEQDSLSHRAEPMRTRLATSSMISYFNDRVLTPEMMRAMIILYIGAHNRPDFATDYLLSPVLAPDELLERFPKSYFMTGERDPLVDDTVIFAGRLKRAKENAMAARDAESQRTGHMEAEIGHEERLEASQDAAEVVLLPGVSHGFLQFPGLYPPAWKHFDRTAVWFEQLFGEAEQRRRRKSARKQRQEDRLAMQKQQAVKQQQQDETGAEATGQGDTPSLQRRAQGRMFESSGEEDRPLEMSMGKAVRGRTTQPDKDGSPSRDNAGKAELEPEGTEKVQEADKDKDKENGKTNGNGGPKKNRKRRKTLNKNKSLVKLNSTDDLLGRRMQGLTSGLTGLGDAE